MVNRKERSRIAQETLKILQAGSYVRDDGDLVDLSKDLEKAKNGTMLYSPDALKKLTSTLALPEETSKATVFKVINCTTFAAARAVISDDGDPLCLNFASAKNPGGGFLSGSQAQEESLARASALYACLLRQRTYYDVNRVCGTSLYTNHIIYSPRVPVFRDDDDKLLDQPYVVSIVTSPAVNAGALRRNEPKKTDDIEPTMKHRIESVLAIARHQAHRSLVLGAWGCGVFGNDPSHIAAWFHDALTKNPLFAGAFDRVFFAVLDRTAQQATFRAFRDRLA